MGGAKDSRQDTGPSAAGHRHADAASSRPRIRLVALDLDGVVWKGGRLLPGVVNVLEWVLDRGLDLRYVSNNSTAHREAVSERLADLGLPAGVDRVLTSGFVTARWLCGRLPEGAPVMVVGEQGLIRELQDVGLDAHHAREALSPPMGAPPAAVAVGMDRSFSYDVLAAAQRAVMEGALFVATNPDATFPTPDGLLPGSGSLVAAVATAAETEPVFMGKPGLALAEILAAVSGVSAGETLFVGDRLSTDIAMGKAAGMVTLLVLTGVTGESDLRRAEARTDPALLPDHVLADLGGLPGLVDELLRC
ncbi:MAG: HAD-IIA family hydrolase [Actinobacteria bacterium]|nr:HAD-IIA family hydrolase [Actinomycetota bacterium]